MTFVHSVSQASLHEKQDTLEPRTPSPPRAHQEQHGGSEPQGTIPAESPLDDHLVETPAGSTSGVSAYHTSEYSDCDDQFLQYVDFSDADPSVPSFLEDHTTTFAFDNEIRSSESLEQHGLSSTQYPLTPEQTASLYTTSPRSVNPSLPQSVSPQELQRPFKPHPTIVTSGSHLSPSLSSSNRSSEEGRPGPTPAMMLQSPRVTISNWDNDRTRPSDMIGGDTDNVSDTSLRDALSSTPRGLDGSWKANPVTGQAGLDPSKRPTDEMDASINETAARREANEAAEERNKAVDEWIKEKVDVSVVPVDEPADKIQAIDQPGQAVDDGIELGDKTVNKRIDGQLYYSPTGQGDLSEIDRDLILSSKNWGQGPVLEEIQRSEPGRHQPPTSQAAIDRFMARWEDSDSIMSRAATWGTRRRSFHSLADIDVEGITSGNFLKKLSISGSHTNKPNRSNSILKNLGGMIRRPSVSGRNKKRAHQDESGYQDGEGSEMKRDSIGSSPLLAPPDASALWGKKSPTPSLNTALMSMAQGAAAVGSSHHARNGSISGTPIMSPKSPGRNSLSVIINRRGNRSVSEVPKPSPGLMELIKGAGGLPVASVNKVSAPAIGDLEDDDEEDDDLYDDTDLKTEANQIDGTTPNLAGFQQHVRTLNPELHLAYDYLVDRIAHQQVVRYKHLLQAKVKHLGLGAGCPCGSLCIAAGGSANLLDVKGDAKGIDPLATQFDDEDDDTPTEGVINQDSFPQDIPMPPTQYLPAELECQLCYQKKKFQKPSDWTKHVHEDVQPFTCTWDRCREPKMFKRKADWVRHENEGHRHLEWWTCDVEDCHHTCYRRDNFLQHLVREHKFVEPKLKTKAAMKRAGGGDPTWQKVEQCHVETSRRPQEEPCRFCGKQFPTWKKLTVHLAKHMESIALPVLRLVAAKAKELDADTIISPVQDPPPRNILSMGPMHSPSVGGYPHTSPQQMFPGHSPYAVYPNVPSGQVTQPFYPDGTPHFGVMDEALGNQAAFGQPHLGQPNLAGATGNYIPQNANYMGVSDHPGQQFHQINPLGLQNVPVMAMGGQLGYDQVHVVGAGNTMQSNSIHNSPFSGQESVSPFQHSPHQNAMHNHEDGNMWDSRGQSGFM